MSHGTPRYQVANQWVPRKRENTVYPISERNKNLGNVDRVLARCLEINLGPDEVNLIYDTSGLCRMERKHVFHGHKQVSSVAVNFLNYLLRFKINFSGFFLAWKVKPIPH